MARLNIEDLWDFYPARINDEPASVFLNFDFAKHAPIENCPYIAWLFIDMPAPAEHGMGDPATADRLRGVEDSLVATITERTGGYQVARIRGEGMWQLYFYVPSPEAFDAVVEQLMVGFGDLEFDSGTKEDGGWSYYFEFLWPTEERMRYIRDRSVVEQLEKHGDPLAVPRTVSHWVYFPDAASRDRYEQIVVRLGFTVENRSHDPEAESGNPFGIQIERDDAVDLETIHEVVMELVEAAQDAGGVYDGWETFIVKPSAE